MRCSVWRSAPCSWSIPCVRASASSSPCRKSPMRPINSAARAEPSKAVAKSGAGRSGTAGGEVVMVRVLLSVDHAAVAGPVGGLDLLARHLAVRVLRQGAHELDMARPLETAQALGAEALERLRVGFAVGLEHDLRRHRLA